LKGGATGHLRGPGHGSIRSNLQKGGKQREKKEKRGRRGGKKEKGNLVQNTETFTFLEDEMVRRLVTRKKEGKKRYKKDLEKDGGISK